MTDLPVIKPTMTIQEVAKAKLVKVVAQTEEGRPIGYSFKEILAFVKKKFPNSKTTIKCLYYYQANLREQGHILPIRPRYNIGELIGEENE